MHRLLWMSVDLVMDFISHMHQTHAHPRQPVCFPRCAAWASLAVTAGGSPQSANQKQLRDTYQNRRETNITDSV